MELIHLVMDHYIQSLRFSFKCILDFYYSFYIETRYNIFSVLEQILQYFLYYTVNNSYLIPIDLILFDTKYFKNNF